MEKVFIIMKRKKQYECDDEIKYILKDKKECNRVRKALSKGKDEDGYPRYWVETYNITTYDEIQRIEQEKQRLKEEKEKKERIECLKQREQKLLDKIKELNYELPKIQQEIHHFS